MNNLQESSKEPIHNGRTLSPLITRGKVTLVLTLIGVLFAPVLLPHRLQADGRVPSIDIEALQDLDLGFAERFGGLALECVHRQYPNKISHVLQNDGDAQTPRSLTPAFYGCYDWHSAVHGHWLLARLARSFPESEIAGRARTALAQSLTAENIAGEVEYLSGPGRVSFERPYGLAWLLQLAAELRQWAAKENHEEAQTWQTALEPLERLAADRLKEWIPKLTHPIRIGEHSQTAFAFGLVIDWARIANDREMLNLLYPRIREMYLGDRTCPLSYEPSGHDFLSPCLAEADLIRRYLSPGEFSAWLGAFLPQTPFATSRHQGSFDWLAPAVVTDPGDPKLAHLDGLNLSRAWMLEGIVKGLPANDPRIPALVDAARHHRQAGLKAVHGAHYEGGHWLGSFAMYLLTQRGGGNVLSAGQLDLVYRGIDRQLAADVVMTRAQKALKDVTEFLGIEYDDRILLETSYTYGIPYQVGNEVHLPAARFNKPDKYGASIVHEITHVLAASAFRPDRFYDDGLAVYLQSEFGMASSYPNFGNDLHEETARLAKELGGFLPLAETEAVRQSQGGEKNRLAYLQEGSFTRFLIERNGVKKYWKIYTGTPLVEIYGLDLAGLEKEWLATFDQFSC